MSVSTNEPPEAPDAEAIWHEFHEGLLGFISRRVRSRETAEDLLQEVMLRIHRQVAEVERADALAAWVHAIARNAIADYYRSASVHREVPTGGEIAPQDGGETEVRDLRSELAACVAPLLKRLPTTYQEALSMTELEGMTQAEAAASMGLSWSGMKSRVQRARAQLKRVLIDCCEVELDRRRGIRDYRPRRSSCDCERR